MPDGGIELVARLMGVSRRYVYLALAGQRSGGKAAKIRKCAINHGGTYAIANIPEGEWLSRIDRPAGIFEVLMWNGYLITIPLRANGADTVMEVQVLSLAHRENGQTSWPVVLATGQWSELVAELDNIAQIGLSRPVPAWHRHVAPAPITEECPTVPAHQIAAELPDGRTAL